MASGLDFINVYDDTILCQKRPHRAGRAELGGVWRAYQASAPRLDRRFGPGSDHLQLVACFVGLSRQVFCSPTQAL